MNLQQELYSLVYRIQQAQMGVSTGGYLDYGGFYGNYPNPGGYSPNPGTYQPTPVRGAPVPVGPGNPSTR
jgi:hypothetical protein